MSSEQPAEQVIDQVRQFNRFYTERIGVLDEGLLDSPFTLTEVRVLYELEHSSSIHATRLSEQLRLDAGYLSRILRRFEKSGLIRRTRTRDDARQSEIRLTAKGHRTLRPLEERSRAQIAHLLGDLSPSEHRTLTRSMQTISALLDAGRQSDKTEPEQQPLIRRLGLGEVGWIIHRQALLYAHEYGWNQEFEALLAEIGAQFIRRFKPEHERAWVAEHQGRVVGSVFLVRKSRKVAQLRLLYVESEARGLGIGARLVDECLASARALGYTKMVLWTNSVLDAARRIYQARGFRLVSEEAHHSFGKDLVGQYWELPLQERQPGRADQGISMR